MNAVAPKRQRASSCSGRNLQHAVHVSIPLKKKSLLLRSTLPGSLGEKSGDAEEEEHEEHTGVLEVVHVSGIEDATVYEDLKVGCVEKLDAEVKKGPAHDQVEL